MRLGVIADIHGNDEALRAVLKDADRVGVDSWWALGDLVLFGPRPAEVLELLHGLPAISMLRGNTDRYVLTGEQPAPHATAADAAASIDLWSATGPWRRESAGLAASWTKQGCSPAWSISRCGCVCGCRAEPTCSASMRPLMPTTALG